MKKKLILIGIISLLALVLTFLVPQEDGFININGFTARDNAINQKITGVRNYPQKFYQVNYHNQKIGVLKDKKKIDQMLDKVYKEKFSESFADSKIGLGTDIYISEFLSYYDYENVDTEIVDYLEDKNNFSFEVYKIQVSNGNYLYVKDTALFDKAKEKFILNYISKDGYNLLKQSKLPDEIVGETGSRELSIKILETLTVSREMAPNELILTTEDEILQYLGYGYNYVPKYYTVKKGDTVEGVARAVGLDPQQVLMINKDISSVEQVLPIGMKVEVTKFNSPITIVVEREAKAKETIDYKVQQQKDPTMKQGTKKTIIKGMDGYKQVTYLETYVNGVLTNYQQTSSHVIQQPRNEVVKVGTKYISGTGSGRFRWPVNNPRITCRWGCYSGHTALDMQDKYNTYGPILASDTGVVIKNAWTRTAGWHVVIDHKNGYKTQYNHMKVRSPISVGQKVEKGNKIGTIGSTGVTTGPHLHFAVEKNGRRINPCIVLGC